MEDIKIEILPNLYLKEDGTFDLEKALQMSGKIAGLCYAKTSFHDILEEDKLKSLMLNIGWGNILLNSRQINDSIKR